MTGCKTCYGCGAELNGYGEYRKDRKSAAQVFLYGGMRDVCQGRGTYNNPSKTCTAKAIVRLHDERTCPNCGEPDSTRWYGASERTSVCQKCDAKIQFAEKNMDGELRAINEVRADAMVELVTAIANHRTFDEHSGYTGWPFSVLVRSRVARDTSRDQHARMLKLSIRKLWEAMGKMQYEKGLQAGANLLSKLHAGGLGSVEFEEQIEDSHGRYDKEKSAFFRAVRESVKEACGVLGLPAPSLETSDEEE